MGVFPSKNITDNYTKVMKELHESNLQKLKEAQEKSEHKPASA